MHTEREQMLTNTNIVAPASLIHENAKAIKHTQTHTDLFDTAYVENTHIQYSPPMDAHEGPLF